MYETKQLLPSRGQLKINIIFHGTDGGRYVETGYSQSVNVKSHFKQMVDEATLNALYKVNHRLGQLIFRPDNYEEDLAKYAERVDITSYKIRYFEDYRYSYKREKVGHKYEYVVRRDGKVFNRVKPNSLTKDELAKIEDKIV